MISRSLFEARFRRGLPEDLARIHDDVRAAAKRSGLDTFPIIFEVVTPEEMSMLAAFGGFPSRYPHWRFGMEFEQLHKSYEYGLSKIYEMVINTDPCYAYLMDCNAPVDQKLVMAHVYGHCDFFKNNLWFAGTNRRMVDTMANHGARVRTWIDRIGLERVEAFLDLCLSVENLIDPHQGAIRRQNEGADPLRAAADRARDQGVDPALPDASLFKAEVDRSYMDAFVNPPSEVLDRRERALQESLAPRRVPERPERDVLGFLLQHAPLKQWEQEILSIVREEALYFVPQGQTKIMNEGWATFWHTRLMTDALASGKEIVDYADHHSGTVAMSAYRLNPYKLGLELFRDIEARWDTGRHGAEYETCDDVARRRTWFRDERGGLEKVFEVRRIYNDVGFVDAFLTEDFCEEHGFFTYGKTKGSGRTQVESREWTDVKTRLLAQLTNFGQPIIEVTDLNGDNRGELVLQHRHAGADLQMDWAELTLGNVERLWRRPVVLETIVGNKVTRLRHDGQQCTRQSVDGKAK